MRRRPRAGLLVPALAVLAGLGAPAPGAATGTADGFAAAGGSAAAKAPAGRVRCAVLTPQQLAFDRPRGATSGVLRWRAPRRAVRRTPALRWRVYRSGRVIGQTVRRQMRIRVRVGRTYTLMVAAVDRSGRPTRCRARLVVRDAYRPPAAPRLVTVGATDGAGTTISWEASQPGDTLVAGYRVLREGRVYRQTSRTEVAIPLSSNRSASFTVAAIDRRGVLSAASEAVRITTGHAPPPVPQDVRVAEVTDSAVALRWSASVPRRGRLAGYRILRDGVPLFQVSGTEARAVNLWASRRYTFAVQAIDTLGAASAPSADLAVRTADPESTEGHLHAFLLASTDQSFRDFQEHYRQIGTVHPTYYDCSPGAQLVGRDDPLITGWAQSRRVEVLARFNCQRTSTLNRILNDPALRRTWIDGIAARVSEIGADGASLDFEAGLYTDRDAFTSFVRELAGRLHAQGQRLALAVSAKTADVPRHPRSTFYDYKALAEAADVIFVMAWGIKWATSGPGAQDDITWVRKVADYVATMPNRSKFVMGTHLYAMDWPNGGGAANPASAYEYAEAVERAGAMGTAFTHDPVSDGVTFSYVAGGVPHTVWLADAQTAGRRFALAAERGLGIGVWRLGREDQRLWAHPLLAPRPGSPAP